MMFKVTFQQSKLDSQLQSLQKNKNIDDLTKQWQLQADTVGMTARQIEIYKASLDEATKGRVEELKVLDSLLTQKEREAEQQQQLQQQKQAVADLVEEWQRQLETIGMTSREIEIYKAAMNGMDTSKLEDLNRALTAQEKSAELADNINRVTESLQFQAATFGMASTEIELYRLRLAGATEEQLKAAEAAAQSIKNQTEQQRLQQIAHNLMEKHRSPAEKFAKERDELNRLMEAQKISLEVYYAELEELKRKYNIDTSENFDNSLSSKFTSSPADMKSLQAGSQEAQLALLDWHSKFAAPASPIVPQTSDTFAAPDPMTFASAASEAISPVGYSVASSTSQTLSSGSSDVLETLKKIEQGINQLVAKDSIEFSVASFG